jgi:hypothetical protein
MLSNLYVKIGLYAAAVVLGIYIGYRFEHNRLVAYRATVAAAAKQQEISALQTEKAWQQKYTEALAINAQNQKWISDHNQPVPRVLCHYASASPVPASPAPADAGATASGALPPETGGDFDPTERLTALADEADQVVEACRVVINSWPR